MIAGLLQSNTLAGLTQVPGLKDVPVVGDLMKSDVFTRNESEVIVMITPYLGEIPCAKPGGGSSCTG